MQFSLLNDHVIGLTKRSATSVMLLMCMWASHAAATVSYDLKTTGLAATIDDKPISQRLLNRFTMIAKRGDKDVTPNKVLQRIIDDDLLAIYARSRFTSDDLIKDSKVAFSPEVQIQQALSADIVAAFGPEMVVEAKKRTGSDKPNYGQTASHTMTDEDWKKLLSDQPELKLDYHLMPAGRKFAEQLVLRQYRFDANTQGTITLADVYDSQHMQGKFQIHQKDKDYTDQQAQVLMERRYAIHWLEHRSGLTPIEVNAFKQIVVDRMEIQGYLAHIGVAADVHDDMSYMKKIANQVTPEEIQDFYQNHKEMFIRVDRVKARHIRTKDEATANEAFAALKKGKLFADVAKQYSVADDRQNGGDLGWVVHPETGSNWLQSLLFFQPVDKVSNPFRMPGKPTDAVDWEIVLVEQKDTSYQPVTSESVHYVASLAIAKQKVMQEYLDARVQVWKQAKIHIRPDLVLSMNFPQEGMQQ
ncbi:MAG: peptidyl-prolyl cis-trans isomerase [Gammaproteobacteria bacterium]|nr:peptidyl-prolyl cis-trans isomerase [Gammaproteobacteria bacterium]